MGTGLGVALVSIGKILGPNKPDTRRKTHRTRCGFEAFEDARMKFDVRYYLVAILFIIFDLETAFLFPWGVALRDIGWPGFMAMMIFCSNSCWASPISGRRAASTGNDGLIARFAWVAQACRPSRWKANEYRRGLEGRVCHHDG